MTNEEFANGVDIILAREPRGHSMHRALDLLWTRYTQELPETHPLRTATAKWMRAIEGDHDDAEPYPLPRMSWAKRPWACKWGHHLWVDTTTEYDYGSVRDCVRCGVHDGYGNPCP